MFASPFMLFSETNTAIIMLLVGMVIFQMQITYATNDLVDKYKDEINKIHASGTQSTENDDK